MSVPVSIGLGLGLGLGDWVGDQGLKISFIIIIIIIEGFIVSVIGNYR